MRRRRIGLAARIAAALALVSALGAGSVLLGGWLPLPGPAWVGAASAASVAVAAAAAVGLLGGRRLASSIASLAELADAIIRGETEARSARRPPGEVGVLAENLDLVAERVAVLTRHAGERAALETELAVGQRIEELASPSEPLSVDRVATAGALRPASPAGGGFWLRRALSGGRTLVAIGDATGRGLPTALLTATAQAAVDVAVAALGEEIRPDRLLHLANHAVYESARRAQSMTCFVAILDPEAGTAQCANAGHPFPYLRRAAAGDGGALEPVTCRGNRLGALRSSHYEPWCTEVAPGDVLVLFTEGLVCAERAPGDAYGEKRLRHAIRRHAGGSPEAVCDGVLADHEAFLAGAPAGDDVVVAVAGVAAA